MFRTYVIHDPNSDGSVSISMLSYIGAGLFGFVYVLVKIGTRRFFTALGLSVLFALAFAAMLAGSSMVLPTTQQALVIIVGTPILLALQSLRMIALVINSYRRRGWTVHNAD